MRDDAGDVVAERPHPLDRLLNHRPRLPNGAHQAFGVGVGDELREVGPELLVDLGESLLQLADRHVLAVVRRGEPQEEGGGA